MFFPGKLFIPIFPRSLGFFSVFKIQCNGKKIVFYNWCQDLLLPQINQQNQINFIYIFQKKVSSDFQTKDN